MLRIDQRIVLVVRKTRLDDLTAKYATRGQARFHKSRARVNQMLAQAPSAPPKVLQEVAQAAEAEVGQVEEESRQYHEVINDLRTQLDFDLPVQVVDRS